MLEHCLIVCMCFLLFKWGIKILSKNDVDRQLSFFLSSWPDCCVITPFPISEGEANIPVTLYVNSFEEYFAFDGDSKPRLLAV